MREALRLARADARDPAVLRLVGYVLPIAAPCGRARAALLMVQALPYVPDPAGEWLQPGAYTATRGGDCEDLASLLVVVAESAGVPGELLWLAQETSIRDHVTTRLLCDGRWQWAEATLRGAMLGESPYVASSRLMERGGL